MYGEIVPNKLSNNPAEVVSSDKYVTLLKSDKGFIAKKERDPGKVERSQKALVLPSKESAEESLQLENPDFSNPHDQDKKLSSKEFGGGPASNVTFVDANQVLANSNLNKKDNPGR